MKKKEQRYDFITVFLLGGGTIEVKYPDSIIDEFFQEMRDAINAGDEWYVGNYTEAEALYCGQRLEHINTRLIVGWR